MNLTEILNKQNDRIRSFHRQDQLSTLEQYIYSYCDAAFRYLKTFEICRLQQYAIVNSSSWPGNHGFTLQMSDLERQCGLAVESVYTYIHRIEIIVRQDGRHAYDILKQSTLDQSDSRRWLQDLRFMSEIRNKVIEHAPENLVFHSNWGQIFHGNNPFEFRLWILNPSAMGMLQKDETIKTEIDRICQIIWQHITPDPSPTFGKLFDIVNGAGYLENSDMRMLFKTALQETGCISHTPTMLAAKLSNIFEFAFPTPRQ